MSQRKLCGAGLLFWMSVLTGILDTASSSSVLRITQCVIVQYNSITCYWETTERDLNGSSYQLQINIIYCDSKNSFIPVGCCDTRGSHCSVQPINSELHCFHAVVSKHNSSIRSLPHFFRGVDSVKLPPPLIREIRPSATHSGCLQVIGEMTESFSMKERDDIRLQMEYITHGQTRSQIVKAFSVGTLELCDLYAGSVFTVRLRARDKRDSVYWSSWTSVDNKTAEKAPSAAPRLWRLIQPAGVEGKRRLTLLWKAVPWPEINGVVLRYSASCHCERDSPQRSCGALNASRRSCVLIISKEPCDCSLTASNSAGTSPPAHIHIPAHAYTDELPPPQGVSATPLDDTRLKVEWTVAPNLSESGFVLQWTSVPYNETNLNWEYMNETSRSFILTDLLPEVPYNLSVVSLYGRRTGSVIAFTREGAPSAGPVVTMLKTSSSVIHLKWEPVPLEKLHGFIRHYTVIYSINGKEKSVTVSGDVREYSLRGLSEGIYSIHVEAHTAAGGAAEPRQMLDLGVDDVQVIPILLCAILGTFLMLTISVCLRVRIKQCLFPTVPDPSKSSLSTWSTAKLCQQRQLTSTLSSIISLGSASGCQGCVEKDYVPVQVFTYQKVQRDDSEAQTYSSTSVITYMDPKLQTHLLNQTYSNQEKLIPEDTAELFFESLFSSKTNQDDLCGYIHVSQSYAPFVSTVDPYRTLEVDELPRFLQVLSDNTTT